MSPNPESSSRIQRNAPEDYQDLGAWFGLEALTSPEIIREELIKPFRIAERLGFGLLETELYTFTIAQDALNMIAQTFMLLPQDEDNNIDRLFRYDRAQRVIGSTTAAEIIENEISAIEDEITVRRLAGQEVVSEEGVERVKKLAETMSNILAPLLLSSLHLRLVLPYTEFVRKKEDIIEQAQERVAIVRNRTRPRLEALLKLQENFSL